MRRTKEDALKTYRSILDTSLNLFNNNGYNATTISDIAKSANVTRGAVYWHFKNKGDIFIAIGDLHLADIKTQLHAAIKSCSPLEDLATIISNFFTILEEDAEKYKFCALMHRYSTGFSAHQNLKTFDIKIQQHYFNLWHKMTSDIISSAKEKKELHPSIDELFANIYIRSSVMGLCHCYFNAQEQIDVSKYSKRVMTEVIQNLRNLTL